MASIHNIYSKFYEMFGKSATVCHQRLLQLLFWVPTYSKHSSTEQQYADSVAVEKKAFLISMTTTT